MITKEAIEAGCAAIDRPIHPDDMERILTAAFAAMPGPAVKVKPLVWNRDDDMSFVEISATYYLERWPGYCALITMTTGKQTLREPFPSVEAAKAAAQADYEARILSAITPATDLQAENDRLRAALLECEEYFDNRADADCDQDGYIPNAEMKMLTIVRAALERT